MSQCYEVCCFQHPEEAVRFDITELQNVSIFLHRPSDLYFGEHYHVLFTLPDGWSWDDCIPGYPDPWDVHVIDNRESYEKYLLESGGYASTEEVGGVSSG